MIVPPPTPKRPLKAPAAVPTTASLRRRWVSSDTRGDTRWLVSAAPHGHEALLEPFLAAPERCAVLMDVDGTLAPIVDRPEDAAVPDETTRLLARARGAATRWSRASRGGVRWRRAGWSAFPSSSISATRASSSCGPARRSRASIPPPSPAATAPGSSWRASIRQGSSASASARRTRGRSRFSTGAAPPTRRRREDVVKAIARLAVHANLIPLWGRKVLDLRPVAGIDKGSAVHRLLVERAPLDAAIFAGDDRTDLDAFRALKRLAGTSRLGTAVCLGVFTRGEPGRDRDRGGHGRRGHRRRPRSPQGAAADALLRAASPHRLPLRGSRNRARRGLCRPRQPGAAVGPGARGGGRLVARRDRPGPPVGNGRARRPRRSRRRCARRRRRPILPSETEGRIAFMRLWPIGAFALICVVAGAFWPQVTAIGAGYAILIALGWRRREAAVQAIEDRDGVRFHVEPSAAHRPLKLVRTPGLYRDRAPSAKPPPPPPAPS